jgi:cobyrinic acid a,c-diamide synthase
MQASDIGIVEGRFDDDVVATPNSGGRLDSLCELLDLPRIAVVNASHLRRCVLPDRPAGIDGLLLDCVSDGDFHHFQTSLEALWGVPVLGGLTEMPGVRAVVDHLPSGSRPSKRLCRKIGDELRRHLRLEAILRLAERRGLPACRRQLFAGTAAAKSLNIAVAYDEAFCGYFPDGLDLLEMHGARIRDFSPLRDERLPPDTDLVFLGCGQPESFADELARNCCMQMALRRHFCRGRRIYAEGSGVAYLCRQMVRVDGWRLPMVGLLPAIAWQVPDPTSPRPLEVDLAGNNWLRDGGRRVRGYLDPRWVLQRAGAVTNCVLNDVHRDVIFARHQAIASQMHLNLVGQPQLVQSFIKSDARELATA